MKRLGSLLPTFVVTIGLILGLTACKREKMPHQPITDIHTNNAKEMPQTAAGAAEKIGILACDIYLEKYTQCLTRWVPGAKRDQMNKNLEQTRDIWKRAASAVEGKAGLAAACNTALETAKRSLAIYKCDW